MLRFSFPRSVVLNRVEVVRNDRLQRTGFMKIVTEFHGSVTLPTKSISQRVTHHLDDMSLRVVDFGTLLPGQQPTKAIIAVGKKQYLPLF